MAEIDNRICVRSAKSVLVAQAGGWAVLILFAPGEKRDEVYGEAVV